MSHLRLGFAAACAVVAMPFPKPARLFRGYALVRLRPLELLGQRPHEGHRPEVEKATSAAGHSHRREANSGGEAETQVANHFEAKPIVAVAQAATARRPYNYLRNVRTRESARKAAARRSISRMGGMNPPSFL